MNQEERLQYVAALKRHGFSLWCEWSCAGWRMASSDGWRGQWFKTEQEAWDACNKP